MLKSPLAVNNAATDINEYQRNAANTVDNAHGGLLRRPESLSQVNQVPDLSHFNQVICFPTMLLCVQEVVTHFM